jgi:predicted ATPase
LRLQVALGRALYVGGHREPEGGRAFGRAYELCRELGDTSELLPTLWGVWAFHFNRGEPSIALKVAEDLVHRAEKLGDRAGQMMGHRLLGAALYVLGRLGEARLHLEKALALYDPLQDRGLAALYGYDVHVTVLYYLSITLVPFGYPSQAVKLIAQALANAKELCHLPTLAFALDGVCQVHELLNDPQAVLDHVDELIALAMEQGFEYWLPLGLCRRGWALTELGQIEDGKAQLQRGIAAMKGKMLKRGLPQHLAHLAQAYAKAGSTMEGLALLAEAFENLEPWYESELHRLKGELLLSLPEACQPDAEVCFHRSLAAAQQQSAKLWELRAASSLSRLWRSQQRDDEVRPLLTPIYDWFMEGFNTRDLKEAQMLLDGD